MDIEDTGSFLSAKNTSNLTASQQVYNESFTSVSSNFGESGIFSYRFLSV